MADFWKYFKNLFQAAEQSSPTQPYIHEVIERSEEEKKDYEHWKGTLVRTRLFDWLREQYAIYQTVPENIDEHIDFLDTPSSKGFVIHFSRTRYNKRDLTHAFDLLREKVLQLHYKTHVSDVRSFIRNDWVETIERHYLKPKPSFMTEGKLDQQFGNITIESVLRADRPFQLKFQATTYSDHLFQDAGEFRELLLKLLG